MHIIRTRYTMDLMSLMWHARTLMPRGRPTRPCGLVLVCLPGPHQVLSQIEWRAGSCFAHTMQLRRLLWTCGGLSVDYFHAVITLSHHMTAGGYCTVLSHSPALVGQLNVAAACRAAGCVFRWVEAPACLLNQTTVSVPTTATEAA